MRNIRQMGKIRSIASVSSPGGFEILPMVSINPTPEYGTATGTSTLVVLDANSFDFEVTGLGNQNNRPYIVFNTEAYKSGDKVYISFNANILSGVPFIRNMYLQGANDPNHTVVQGYNELPVYTAGGDGSAFNLYFSSLILYDLEVTDLKAFILR